MWDGQIFNFNFNFNSLINPTNKEQLCTVTTYFLSFLLNDQISATRYFPISEQLSICAFFNVKWGLPSIETVLQGVGGFYPKNLRAVTPGDPSVPSNVPVLIWVGNTGYLQKDRHKHKDNWLLSDGNIDAFSGFSKHSKIYVYKLESQMPLWELLPRQN